MPDATQSQESETFLPTDLSDRKSISNASDASRASDNASNASNAELRLRIGVIVMLPVALLLCAGWTSRLRRAARVAAWCIRHR